MKISLHPSKENGGSAPPIEADVENCSVMASENAIYSWTRPDMSALEGAGFTALPFPTQLFGEGWSEWIGAVAEGANAPIDYVGASLLTISGALMGNSIVASYGAWTEPPILWAVLVGGPSSGKSPAMDQPIQLLDSIEADTHTAIRIDDVSVAAAGVRAADCPKGNILVNDELSSWWSGFGRLGGEQYWLKAYGARSHSIDRKDKPTVYIRRLAVSVLGGAQPDTIRAAISGKQNRGFASRCLFIYPNPVQGFRMAARPDHALAEQALRRLAVLGDGTETYECPLTPDAEVVAQRWIEQKIAEANEAEGVWAEWLGKQRGNAMRIALIFEHLWWAAEAPLAAAPPEAVSVQAYEAAIEFIDEYAAPMALRTMAAAHAPAEDQLAARLAKLIRKSRAQQINLRDVRRGVFGPAGDLSDSAKMRRAAETLEAASLIRHIGVRADGKAGRAPALYEVNPRLQQQEGRR
jgi:hypothetical protein